MGEKKKKSHKETKEIASLEDKDDSHSKKKVKEKKSKKGAKLAENGAQFDQNHVDLDIVDEGESKKKKSKYKIVVKAQEEETLVDESHQKKSKKDRKKAVESSKEAISADASFNIDDPVDEKKKHKKVKDKTENLDTTFGDSSMSVTKKRKRKFLEESSSSVTLDSSALEQTESPAAKKSRKERKKKSKEESSLGVVDTSILKQAQTNLGLPMADGLGKETLAEKSESANSVIEKEKKKKKDKKPKETKIETPNEKNRNERAVEYLKLWNENRKAWKFSKMMQVQLLKIMYDKSLLNDEDFETLLLYLDGLKGLGREKTKEVAGKLLKDDKEETEPTSGEKEERARQIYQMLC